MGNLYTTTTEYVDSSKLMFREDKLISSLTSTAKTVKLDPDNIGVVTKIQVGGETSVIRDKEAHDEIAELREMIERLKGKPYYMKIQCHNCGAPLTIDSSNHLVKCRYCKTAYFSGTQLVNSTI